MSLLHVVPLIPTLQHNDTSVFLRRFWCIFALDRLPYPKSLRVRLQNQYDLKVAEFPAMLRSERDQ
jgi:hypothetical protein